MKEDSQLKWPWLLVSMIMLIVTCVYSAGTEQEAQKWLEGWEAEFSQNCFLFTLASWNSGININTANKKALDMETKRFTDFNANIQKELLQKFPNWKEFKNKRLRRAFKYLAIDGPATMPIDRVNLKNQINSDMEMAYGSATVCRYNNRTACNMPLNEIDVVLKNSHDPKELAYYFTAWHDKMSQQITADTYQKFIDLQTEYANANGFKFHSEFVLIPYDDESEGWTFRNFQQIMVGLAEETSQLYQILHAYVRMKLRNMPEFAGTIDKCGYIPAHLTGNMWAQDWTSLDKLTKPYPNAPKLDATDAMVKQGYTPLKMFQESDKFFKELGLMGMSKEFWANSVLEKPKDGRDMVCHATAWDMCLGKGSKDFRIRQCTAVSQKDFIVAHHEMGHIEYFQQYTDLEFPFRTSANPGFHEAIGDALALAVVTPSHLQCKLKLDLGFEKSFCNKRPGPFKVSHTDINYLYLIALSKLAFFPFAASIDFWRFEVWEGKIKKEDYNKMWWNIRKAFQGIVPPTDRGSDATLFDPAAKWHIPTNCDYLRYLISAIVQFQFYEALCIESGEYNPKIKNGKPLYQCDFSGSKKAGKKFAEMMKLGFSKGWPDALEAVTGSRNLSVKSFQHYVQPVLDYMKKELDAHEEIIGFGDSCEDVEKRKGKSMWSGMVPEHKKPEPKSQSKQGGNSNKPSSFSVGARAQSTNASPKLAVGPNIEYRTPKFTMSSGQINFGGKEGGVNSLSPIPTGSSQISPIQDKKGPAKNPRMTAQATVYDSPSASSQAIPPPITSGPVASSHVKTTVATTNTSTTTTLTNGQTTTPPPTRTTTTAPPTTTTAVPTTTTTTTTTEAPTTTTTTTEAPTTTTTTTTSTQAPTTTTTTEPTTTTTTTEPTTTTTTTEPTTTTTTTEPTTTTTTTTTTTEPTTTTTTTEPTTTTTTTEPTTTTTTTEPTTTTTTTEPTTTTTTTTTTEAPTTTEPTTTTTTEPPTTTTTREPTTTTTTITTEAPTTTTTTEPSTVDSPLTTEPPISIEPLTLPEIPTSITSITPHSTHLSHLTLLSPLRSGSGSGKLSSFSMVPPPIPTTTTPPPKTTPSPKSTVATTKSPTTGQPSVTKLTSAKPPFPGITTATGKPTTTAPRFGRFTPPSGRPTPKPFGQPTLRSLMTPQRSGPYSAPSSFRNTINGVISNNVGGSRRY